MRQYEGHNTPQDHHTDRAAVSIMAKGVCGPSTASEVFFSFTTQLYSYLCNYNAIFS